MFPLKMHAKESRHSLVKKWELYFSMSNNTESTEVIPEKTDSHIVNPKLDRERDNRLVGNVDSGDTEKIDVISDYFQDSETCF